MPSRADELSRTSRPPRVTTAEVPRESMTDSPICRRVIYRGRVQGVGFRMTAARIARRFPIGGSVRNCADGSVELVAAGSAAAIAEYLQAVRSAMQGYISDEQETDGPAGVSTERFDVLL